MKISESEYEQLLKKIDEEPSAFHDLIIEPVGNDDGRIRAALSAILTCPDSQLVDVRIQLQLAYCAYFDIDEVTAEDEFDYRTLSMSRDQIAANDAGVDGRYFK